MSSEIEPGKQLFIDDYFIESLVGARRVLNRPRRVTVDAPLAIRPEKPWEGDRIHLGSVLYDEHRQTFRPYYTCGHGEERRTCVMESDDGVEWRRPNVGLVTFDGATENNIIRCAPAGLGPIWDPRATDEAYRWKACDNSPTGVDPDGSRVWQAYHSADGYDWHVHQTGSHSAQKMLFNFGSPAETFGGVINPDARYIWYSQRGSGRRTRVLGRRDSDDFVSWSGLRTVIDQDLEDPPGTEFYSAAFDPANRTDGGLHLLMLHTFLTDVSEPYEIEEPEKYWGGESGSTALAARIDGFVETQFAVSRDTVSWTRFREPFIPRGEPGAWDWGMLYGGAPIRHGDRLFFFYTGYALTHNGRSPRSGEPRYPTGPRVSGLGLVTLRPDGFVSVEAASYAPGVLTTHRFRQEAGGTLHVNVDASAGELRYELLDGTGAPLAGYTARECDPIRRDALRAPLSWKGVPRWPGVDERRQAEAPRLPANDFYLKLRCYLEPGTKLYSVTLDPPEVAVWKTRVPGRID